MGLGVALFEDSRLSLEPALVLEVNRTTWRRISYLQLHTEGWKAADFLSGCHIVYMT